MPADRDLELGTWYSPGGEGCGSAQCSLRSRAVFCDLALLSTAMSYTAGQARAEKSSPLKCELNC